MLLKILDHITMIFFTIGESFFDFTFIDNLEM